MLKLKSLINVIWIMTILFFYHSINPSTVFAFNYPNGNENVIVDQCPPQDSMQSSGAVSTISGNYNYAPGHTCTKDPDMEYDTANSHETIERNGDADLFVIGNNGPFTWSVSGVGFTLEKENEPTGPTNILYADGSACGPATITVTGCDGEEVKGYVRCRTGTWSIPVISGCILDGEPDTKTWVSQSLTLIKTQGKYKQTQAISATFGFSFPTGCDSGNCADHRFDGGHIGWAWCLYFTCNDMAGYDSCSDPWCCIVDSPGSYCYQNGTCFANGQLYYQEWQCP